MVALLLEDSTLVLRHRRRSVEKGGIELVGEET